MLSCHRTLLASAATSSDDSAHPGPPSECRLLGGGGCWLCFYTALVLNLKPIVCTHAHTHREMHARTNARTQEWTAPIASNLPYATAACRGFQTLENVNLAKERV